MKADLNTLKHIKVIFEIQSDHSTLCLGYKTLCAMIEFEEKKDFRQKLDEKNNGYDPTKEY